MRCSVLSVFKVDAHALKHARLRLHHDVVSLAFHQRFLLVDKNQQKEWRSWVGHQKMDASTPQGWNTRNWDPKRRGYEMLREVLPASFPLHQAPSCANLSHSSRQKKEAVSTTQLPRLKSTPQHCVRAQAQVAHHCAQQGEGIGRGQAEGIGTGQAYFAGSPHLPPWNCL